MSIIKHTWHGWEMCVGLLRGVMTVRSQCCSAARVGISTLLICTDLIWLLHVMSVFPLLLMIVFLLMIISLPLLLIIIFLFFSCFFFGFSQCLVLWLIVCFILASLWSRFVSGCQSCGEAFRIPTRKRQDSQHHKRHHKRPYKTVLEIAHGTYIW